MKVPVYLWLVLALSGFSVSGVAQAEDNAVPVMSVEQYSAAIKSFGLGAAQAEQAARATVNIVEEIRLSAEQPETVDAFASISVDFFDTSSW